MTARGVQDVAPEQKILKQGIVDTMKQIFERFGYSPLETPSIERFDVLAAKYAGGAEILKETFKVEDQAGRDLCLRYDLTVPFARYVGMNKGIKMPFKRYQIGTVFRDGPIKLGRLREFWQCDVDVVGTKSMRADAEMPLIAQAVFTALELEVVIKVNNRKILNGILSYAGIEKEDQETAILSLDKLEKISDTGVRLELKGKAFTEESIDKLLKLVKNTLGSASNVEKIDILRKTLTSPEAREGLTEIEEVLGFVKESGANVVFDASLARGLAYYTNTVFEVYLADGSFASSLAAGGRYNKMIGQFLQGKDSEAYPAVGISFGLEPISVVMKRKGTPKLCVTQVYVVPVGVEKEAFAVAQELRKQGLNVDIDLIGRGVSKNLQFIDSYKIPFALFVGKEELEKGKFKLKNMVTGEEVYLALDRVGSKARSGK